MPFPSWDAVRVAGSLKHLAEEHGTPNRFRAQEIAGGVAPSGDILSISRIVRLQWWQLDECLRSYGLQARYCLHESRNRPACVVVSRINGA